MGLCPLHREQRKRAIAFGWLSALAGFASIVVAAFVPEWMVAIPLIAGFVLIIGGLLGGALGSHIFVVKRIDKHFIWLGKVSPVYLTTFPEAIV